MSISFDLLRATVPDPDNSRELGFAAGEIILSDNPGSSVLGKLGLENCGLGGFTCTCNEDRLPKDIDIYDLIEGVRDAQLAVKDKVVL